jgi:acyl-homoserine lactone acylase PvdQ
MPLALVAAALAAILIHAPPAGATVVDPLPYQTNDYGQGGFHDILPPGENGLTNALGLAAFDLDGSRPAHSFDQYAMYQNLLYAPPGLTPPDLSKYFKDSSFGVPPGHVASVERPRSDVVIVRDSDFGVPHIYGATRAGAEFGAGFAAAEDRLFEMDALRHAGRGQLAGFAGGSPANRAMDQSTFIDAPYTEADLQRQIDALPQLYGADGQQVVDDATNYVAGINLYIDEAKLNPALMPAEYIALGRPLGPDPWKVTDLVATASLIGSILGQGGGNQLAWARVLEGFRHRFGLSAGNTLFADWRERNDPEAPTTVTTGKAFPYELAPAHPAAGALPDPGSVLYQPVVTAATGAATSDISPLATRGVRSKSTRATPARSGSGPGSPADPADAASLAASRGQRVHTSGSTLGGLLDLPDTDSNALLVAARHSVSGHPLAVMGPQIGYFNPQILTEEDIHGPGIDASGGSVAGLSLYVQLGHGQDYAWSATSAGQDIVHTFAVPLCNADGSPPTILSMSYVFRGACTPIDVISQTESWLPSLADSTPPGSETLTAQRTALGIVIARATLAGEPVIYTRLRSTYDHEIDSAVAFSDFDNPDRIHDASDFQHAAYRVGYTYNWFYVDDRDIAYFNSGANPVSDPRVDPTLPIAGADEPEGFDPKANTTAYTPFAQHPQVVNQDFITSWNNKQAPQFSASNSQYGSIYRSQLLDARISGLIAGARKTTLPALVGAMEDAGTVDLRADRDLPDLLDVIGRPTDPALAQAVAELSAWHADGSHRIDRSASGTYAHSQAIAILDAWWPLLVPGEFEPALGPTLYRQLTDQLTIDDPPNDGSGTPHVGSAYDNGWFGYVDKDLRNLLGEPESGRFHRVYCGRGSLAACRAMLESTLRQAIARAADRATLYADPTCTAAGRPGNQECFDSIAFRALGASTVPMMPWVNRPTYQQAVEIPGHRPR